MHEREELPRARPPKHPGRATSTSSLGITTQPLSFSRRRGSSFNGNLLAVPCVRARPSLDVPTPSPAIPSPLSPGLFTLTNDFPAPPKRLSSSQSSMASAAGRQGHPGSRRQSLLPGGLQSLESLADESMQYWNSNYIQHAPSNALHEQETLRFGQSEDWTAAPAGSNVKRDRPGPERRRTGDSVHDAQGVRSSPKGPSRISHEGKHRRSGTLASLATVATVSAQTVYEDALDNMSGDEADIDEENSRETLAADSESSIIRVHGRPADSLDTQMTCWKRLTLPK